MFSSIDKHNKLQFGECIMCNFSQNEGIGWQGNEKGYFYDTRSVFQIIK